MQSQKNCLIGTLLSFPARDRKADSMDVLCVPFCSLCKEAFYMTKEA